MDLLRTQMRKATDKLFLKPKDVHDDAASKETNLNKKYIILHSKAVTSPDESTQDEKIEVLQNIGENVYYGGPDAAKLAGTLLQPIMSMWTEEAPMPLQMQIAKSLSLIVPPNTDKFVEGGYIFQVFEILSAAEDMKLVRWILYMLACSFAKSVRLMNVTLEIPNCKSRLKHVVRRADDQHALTLWNENYGHMALKLLGIIRVN